MNNTQKAKDYAAFFENLQADTPPSEYAKLVDSNIYFEDPFHNIYGVSAFQEVFEKMFEKVDEPKFVVDEIVTNENIAYLKWQFTCSSKGKEYGFEGLSRIAFSKEGKVVTHVDYWDAAKNVYTHVPILGKILNYLARKISE